MYLDPDSELWSVSRFVNRPPSIKNVTCEWCSVIHEQCIRRVAWVLSRLFRIFNPIHNNYYLEGTKRNQTSTTTQKDWCQCRSNHMWNIWYNSFTAGISYKRNILKIKGIDVNAMDGQGMTPFNYLRRQKSKRLATTSIKYQLLKEYAFEK